MGREHPVLYAVALATRTPRNVVLHVHHSVNQAISSASDSVTIVGEPAMEPADIRGVA